MTSGSINTSREFRSGLEPQSSGSFLLFLWVLFALGLPLRLWNVNFGLLLEMHADEPNKIMVVQRLLNWEKPNYFMHPGLLVNFTALVTRVASWFGGGMDRTSILLNGRILSAVAGALTIFPTAFLGMALFGRGVGLLRGSRKSLQRIEWMRSQFPYAYMIGKPSWVKVGFHNPDIEIRFRKPLPDSARL